MQVGNWVGNKNDLGGNHQRALSAGAYTGSALPVAEHQPTDPGLPRCAGWLILNVSVVDVRMVLVVILW